MIKSAMMIYLCVQPDEFYFCWQLEILLCNYKSLGISKNAVHIIIGYHPSKGLSQMSKALITKYQNQAMFFAYPDTRRKKKYLSSLRPHLISKHLSIHPELEDSDIFYHDSDIIMRELPDFTTLSKGTSWYVSDTRSYIGSQCIIEQASPELLEQMCNLVGISVELVLKNDNNVGGAQYYLKNTTKQFWNKVEYDSEALFTLISNYRNHKADEGCIPRSKYKSIDAWYADMWAVLWNGWLAGKNIQIHSELAFCWANERLESWYKTKILHYTGNIQKENKSFFRKANYTHYPPYFDDDLSQISDKSCSYPLVGLIKSIQQTKMALRIDLMDTTFVIPVRIDSPSRRENIECIVKYISMYFNTNVLIVESDFHQKIDPNSIPPTYQYFFRQDSSPFLHRTHINNWMVSQSSSPYVALLDCDAVIPPLQIANAVEMLRTNKASMVLPYDGDFRSVDLLCKTLFTRMLDPNLLTSNHGKFVSSGKRCMGGCVIVNRRDYINAGMENEYFASWGPEDQERVKRMKNLGYAVSTTFGSLYHLSHERKENSSYAPETKAKYLQEYFKICNLNGTNLAKYIETWPWRNKQQDGQIH